MTNINYLARRLWAKTDPFHFLWRHLLDAAAVAEALLPRFVPDGTLPISRLWLCYLVAMHDIGKADPFFQFKPHDITLWDHSGSPSFPSAFAERVDFSAWEVAKLNVNVDRGYTEGFRHEARSADWLRDFHLVGTHSWGQRAADVVALAIRGHHADFDAGLHSGGCIDEDDSGVSTGTKWRPLRDSLAALIADVLSLKDDDSTPPQDFADDHASRVGLVLSGLIVLSDWIASNEKIYRYETITHLDDPQEYFAAARKLASEAVHYLQFDRATEEAMPQAPAFADVWKGDNYGRLRPTQVTLETAVRNGDVPPGLAIIEAPMGEGKTEGAIYLAEVWNRATRRVGTYIALPTQATSNQMFSRYEAFLEKMRPGVAPRLLHGMAWLREPEMTEQEPDASSNAQSFGAEGDAEAERARGWFFDNAKRGLLAPESVGTVDQALFAALNVRHGFLRLFGLSARTLIIDEAHAYDYFMTAILCRLLQWLHALRVPTILLSATLSEAQKSNLLHAWNGAVLPSLPEGAQQAYPLITLAPFHVGSGSTSVAIPVTKYDRETTVTFKTLSGHLQNATKTADFARGLVEDGGCLCVLVNTVAQAQAVFATLAGQKREGLLPTDCNLSQFHARFPAKQRSEIERDVIRKFGKTKDGAVENPDRPRCAILVATQVVEQSLDVDFDAMLSEIAPIDLLLQRSGRMHRHGGRERPTHLQIPVLYILTPETGEYDFGSTGRVYEPYILLRTLALLATTGDTFVFHAPGGFRPAIEAVYGSETTSPQDAVLVQAINASRAAWEQHTLIKEDKATTHLVAEPNRKSFRYAPRNPAVDEDTEGDQVRSYLRAKTRDDDGEPTRSILCLTEEDDFKAWNVAKKTPDKKQPTKWALRHLFLCKASIPARWLKDVPNMPENLPEPRWLKGHAVLLMKKTSAELFRFEDSENIIRLWNDEARGLFEEK